MGTQTSLSQGETRTTPAVVIGGGEGAQAHWSTALVLHELPGNLFGGSEKAGQSQA